MPGEGLAHSLTVQTLQAVEALEVLEFLRTAKRVVSGSLSLVIPNTRSVTESQSLRAKQSERLW